MRLLINGGNSHIEKYVRIFLIRPTETFNLLQTANDTSKLKHPTLFNDVQSVSHKEIAIKNNK